MTMQVITHVLVGHTKRSEYIKQTLLNRGRENSHPFPKMELKEMNSRQSLIDETHFELDFSNI